MELQELEWYQKNGLIDRVLVESNGDNCWTLKFYKDDGSLIGELHTAKKEVRKFRTLDSVGRLFKQLGITRWETIA